jgi:hypothetical protein
MIPEFTDTIRGEISVEGSPPDPEVIDDIPDKRVVYRVLEHRLGEANFLLVQEFSRRKMSDAVLSFSLMVATRRRTSSQAVMIEF